MTRPFALPALPALCVLAALAALVACTPPVGSEGGPCTGGGACDDGLVCLSSLCVRPAEGEGEGECQGDAASDVTVDDCPSIPAAACGPVDDNAILAACRDAGLALRTGLFDAAYDCLAALPTSACAAPDDDVTACFAALTACPLPAAQDLCTQANETCVSEGQNDFALATCIADLTATNLAFRTAYADCFNASAAEPCASVHDTCYTVAFGTLIGGAP